MVLLSDRHVSDNCVQHMLLSRDVFLAGLQAAVLSINNATSTGANVWTHVLRLAFTGNYVRYRDVYFIVALSTVSAWKLCGFSIRVFTPSPISRFPQATFGVLFSVCVGGRGGGGGSCGRCLKMYQFTLGEITFNKICWLGWFCR